MPADLALANRRGGATEHQVDLAAERRIFWWEVPTMIVRLLGVASLADGVWQLVDRKGWTRFWGKSLLKLRKPTTAATAIAAGEMLLGTWLVLGAGGRRLGGRAAKFPDVPGHHPITAA